VNAVAGKLARALRAEMPPRRVAWAVVTGLLVLFPALLSVARAPGFTSSVELLPQAVGEFPPPDDPAYYGGLLADPRVRRTTAGNVRDPLGAFAFRSVTIRRATRGRVIVGARFATPDRARDFIDALAPQLSAASARDLVARARGTSRAVAAQYRAARRAADRRRLRARLRELKRAIREGRPRAVVAGPAETAEVERPADRFVDALPGGFTGRPSPFWAGAAGLLVAAMLWAVALVTLPPRAP
jgi:hypothetical protein